MTVDLQLAPKQKRAAGEPCCQPVVYPGKRYQDWPVDDPAGQPVEVVRRIRYELYHHVWDLIQSLVPSVYLLDLQRPTGGKS